MKICQKKLKLNFSPNDKVSTVREMGWSGKRNGELLGLLTMQGFEAFLTIDKNLQYQQNVDRFPILLVVLDAPNNKIETLKPYVEKLLLLLMEPVQERIILVTLN